MSLPSTNSLVSKYFKTVVLMQLCSELEREEDGFCTHLVNARSVSRDTIACTAAFCCSAAIAACYCREAGNGRGGGDWACAGGVGAGGSAAKIYREVCMFYV